jgi:hypothetical protein
MLAVCRGDRRERGDPTVRQLFESDLDVDQTIEFDPRTTRQEDFTATPTDDPEE